MKLVESFKPLHSGDRRDVSIRIIEQFQRDQEAVMHIALLKHPLR